MVTLCFSREECKLQNRKETLFPPWEENSPDKNRNAKYKDTALKQTPTSDKRVLRKVEIKWQELQEERKESDRKGERWGGGQRTDGNPKRESSWISDKVCPPRVFLMRKIKFLDTCTAELWALEPPRGVSQQNTALQDVCAVPRQV